MREVTTICALLVSTTDYIHSNHLLQTLGLYIFRSTRSIRTLRLTPSSRSPLHITSGEIQDRDETQYLKSGCNGSCDIPLVYDRLFSLLEEKDYRSARSEWLEEYLRGNQALKETGC
jgi:hypothetical protein